MLYEHPFPEMSCHIQSFATLSSYLHSCSNTRYLSQVPLGYDPRNKFGKVLTILQERFACAWISKQHLSIDKGTVPFKGQICLKVYNPNKLVKYGMKTFKLCDFSMGNY